MWEPPYYYYFANIKYLILLRYPDVSIINDIYNDMVEKHKKTDPGLEGDEKYRPLPVLLALLYKIQARNDEFFHTAGKLPGGPGPLPLLAYCWHLQHTLGKKIREKINALPASAGAEEVSELLERNRLAAAAACQLPESSLPLVWVSELGGEGLEDHCPDHTLSLEAGLRCVVLTLLGTRIFPRPNPQDIIMDLAGKTEEFGEGVAHSGMAVGARNVLRHVMGELSQLLAANPGYSLLLVGYSLGAGLAHLVALALQEPENQAQLPPGLAVRAITYGCPPVYGCDREQPPALLPHVLTVQNHNDGISGASLRSINDVFLKTRAINNLHLKRRTLFRMVFAKNPTSSDESIETIGCIEDDCSEEVGSLEAALDAAVEDEDEDEEDEDKSLDGGSSGGMFSSLRAQFTRMVRQPSENKWKQVEQAVESVPSSGQPRLFQLGQNTLVLKRPSGDQQQQLHQRLFTGTETAKFSEKIRFKPSMLDDHMPWAYNKLFSGMGEAREELEGDLIQLLDPLLGIEQQVDESPVGRSSGLYPDLSTLQ